eukprot:scaffold15379_cov133-Isochrysis_galbana.AAC.1
MSSLRYATEMSHGHAIVNRWNELTRSAVMIVAKQTSIGFAPGPFASHMAGEPRPHRRHMKKM